MLRPRVIALLLLPLFLVSLHASAQAASQQSELSNSDARIHHLLEISGSKQMVYQSALMMLDQFRKVAKGLPDAFWDEALDLFSARLDDFLDQMVPIYRRHLTPDEIEGLIKFYESPVGKRFVEEQPAIQQEAAMVGQRWGEEMSKVIIDRMKQKGYVDDQGNFTTPTPSPSPASTPVPESPAGEIPEQPSNE